MTVLAIFGASGHGKVVADAALLSGNWKQVVFYDDAYPSITFIEGWPVLGGQAELVEASHLYTGTVVAIGDNSMRLKKQNFLKKSGCVFVNIIHPAAIVSPLSEIGVGSVVFAGAVINPFAKVGQCCIINSNAVIEHDCVLEQAVHISPGSILAGSVYVGDESWVGLGCGVRQNISICNNVLLGAGAVVVKNIDQSGVYVGIPAKKLNKNY